MTLIFEATPKSIIPLNPLKGTLHSLLIFIDFPLPRQQEYYIMQGDFYTKGENGQPGLQPIDMQKAIDEDIKLRSIF